MLVSKTVAFTQLVHSYNLFNDYFIPLSPHISCSFPYSSFSSNENKSYQKRMTTTPTNKTIYCPRLHFLYFSKDKELVVISKSTSWICSLASLIYQLFIWFSCNCLHFLPNHSSFPPYSHQHIPEVLKISHFMLPSVCLTNFFRDHKPKQIFTISVTKQFNLNKLISIYLLKI